jgi:F0F1-type ATP synthase assembly protein I
MNKKYLVFVGIGFELVGIILTALYLGKLFDEHFGTKGLGIAAFPMIGLVGWIIHVIMLSKSMDRPSINDGDN